MKDVKNIIVSNNVEEQKTGASPVSAQNVDLHAETHTNETDDGGKNCRVDRKFDFLAFAAIILAVASWVILSFNGPTALGVSIVSFVFGCIGLKASTRSWRNTAITAIVASSVLMVVLTAFLLVLYVGLGSV